MKTKISMPSAFNFRCGNDKTQWFEAESKNGIASSKCSTSRYGRSADTQEEPALMSAAWQDHIETVKALIPSEGGKAKIDGQTALMLAARNGHTKAVRTLILAEAGRINVDEKQP